MPELVTSKSSAASDANVTLPDASQFVCSSSSFPMNEAFHHQPGSKVLLVGSFQLVEATQVPLTDPVIQAVGPENSQSLDSCARFQSHGFP